jgi:hypothetical protein
MKRLLMLLAFAAPAVCPAQGLLTPPETSTVAVPEVTFDPPLSVTNAAIYAGNDFSNNHCRLFMTGIQTRALDPRTEYLRTNYQVDCYFMGCLVEPGIGTYNEAMSALLAAKFGKDVLSDANAWLTQWNIDILAQRAAAEAAAANVQIAPATENVQVAPATEPTAENFPVAPAE